MAQTVARLHTVFLDRVKALKGLARAAADFYLGKQPGGWAFPPAATGPITDPKTLTPIFDRDEINANYGEALQGQGAGTIGDVISLQRQIGFVATEERAMRVRYMRPPRAIAHAYGRLNGHASPNGVFSKIQTAAENAVAAGGATTITPGSAL